MKIQWRNFAWVGLALSLLGVIASIGLYIVFQSFDLPIQISLGVIALGLAMFALMDPERVRLAATGRHARYGLNSSIMILAFIGLLIIINLLVFKNPKRWDLTEDKQNTLATETISALSAIKEPVFAQAFYSTRSSAQTVDNATKLLTSYKINSNGLFNYEFIDPLTNPLAAQTAKITRDGTIVLQMSERQEQVTFPSEQDLTSALIRLENPGQRTIYFVKGHGEFDPDTPGENSYSLVKTVLETKNYTIKSFTRITSKIPEDAKAIIIPGPLSPLTDDEVKNIKDYLDKGGALVYLSEPVDPTSPQFNGTNPLDDYLVNEWNTIPGKDMIIDLNVNPPFLAFGETYGNHPITNKLSTQSTIFPIAHSIQIGANQGNLEQTVLVQTGSNAWGETDFAALAQGQYSVDKEKDLVGPVPIAVTSTDPTTKARLVVVGDVHFASDQGFSNMGGFQEYGNRDFIINSIDWAAEQENLINLTPKESIQRFMVPPKQITLGLILLGTVFVLPGLTIFAGIIAWWMRRRRG